MNSGHRGHREEPRVLIEEEVRILPSMGRAGRRRPPPRQHPQDHAGTQPRGDGDAGSPDTHAPERPAASASRPRTPPAWASCCRGPAVGQPWSPHVTGKACGSRLPRRTGNTEHAKSRGTGSAAPLAGSLARKFWELGGLHCQEEGEPWKRARVPSPVLFQDCPTGA